MSQSHPNAAIAGNNASDRPRPAKPAAATELPRLGSVAGMPRLLRASRPDRAARALLRFINVAQRAAGPNAMSLRRQREAWRMVALAMGSRPAVTRVIEKSIDGPGGPIALRIFVPTRAQGLMPAFLWCHGGGFVIGGLDAGDSICRHIALAAGCITMAVRYRLAPEHDLHASREDFLAAVQWVSREGASIGIDATRLAVGGDSAGGNVSAAVAQELGRRGGTPLRLQVLVYPATDLVEEFPSLDENAQGYFLTRDSIEYIKGVLGTKLEAGLDPWLSPRRTPDLGGLPPALIVSAGFDPIRDDGLDYGARLRAAGVPVELLHYAGQFHGFLNFDAVIDASRDALQRIDGYLAAEFRGEAVLDRTVEIADETRSDAKSALGATTGEVFGATLFTWIALERYGNTFLGLLSPWAARAAAQVFGPVLAPARLVRRRLAARLDHLVARQTPPARR